MTNELQAQQYITLRQQGIELAKQGKFTAAMQPLQASLNLFSESPYTIACIAYVQLYSHKFDELKQTIEQGLNLIPDNNWFLIIRGILFAQHKDYPHALQDFEQVIESRPAAKDILWNKLVVLLRMKQYETLMLIMSEYLISEPSSLPASLRNPTADQADAIRLFLTGNRVKRIIMPIYRINLWRHRWFVHRKVRYQGYNLIPPWGATFNL